MYIWWSQLSMFLFCGTLGYQFWKLKNEHRGPHTVTNSPAMAQCLLRTRRMVFPKTSPTLQFVRYRHGPGGQILMNPRASRPERSWKVAAKASQDLMGDIGLLSGNQALQPSLGLFKSLLTGFRYVYHAH